MRKGILLAAGHGTRLYPSTYCVSKQLLPVYDKPMIYYPLSTLMLAGITDILIITWPHEMELFQHLLKDGSQWGIRITYAAQHEARGIAEAFIIAEKFIGNNSVCLMLGDNILYGTGVPQILMNISKSFQPTIIGYYVHDPERYGVIYFDENEKPIKIIEKPSRPTSNYASIGVYFFDADAVEIAKSLKPSKRGELEVTDISRIYLEQNRLEVIKLGRGIAWLDTGTPAAWLEAANFIQILEHRQGLKIGCPEEVAWRRGYITSEQLLKLSSPLLKSGYGQYLKNLLLEQEVEFVE
jgi:glucose-1-phosphate thymidylyltransferase